MQRFRSFFPTFFPKPYRDIQARVIHAVKEDSGCWKEKLGPEIDYAISPLKKDDEFAIDYIHGQKTKRLIFKVTTSGEIIFVENAKNQFSVLWGQYPELINGLIMAGYRAITEPQFFSQASSPDSKDSQHFQRVQIGSPTSTASTDSDVSVASRSSELEMKIPSPVKSNSSLAMKFKVEMHKKKRFEFYFDANGRLVLPGDPKKTVFHYWKEHPTLINKLFDLAFKYMSQLDSEKTADVVLQYPQERQMKELLLFVKTQEDKPLHVSVEQALEFERLILKDVEMHDLYSHLQEIMMDNKEMNSQNKLANS